MQNLQEIDQDKETLALKLDECEAILAIFAKKFDLKLDQELKDIKSL